ncbi:hypothetical protein ANN_02781 [Periplaneta americana]|uniref:Uncharacterized protein n=1 Tax=Periplaneta americana TaxID=6978 RepID=A0ABQ8U1S2_PERAM|nr:hypothetical protein ANN_02781 [Periplaneta americana]
MRCYIWRGLQDTGEEQLGSNVRTMFWPQEVVGLHGGPSRDAQLHCVLYTTTAATATATAAATPTATATTTAAATTFTAKIKVHMSRSVQKWSTGVIESGGTQADAARALNTGRGVISRMWSRYEQFGSPEESH